MSVKKGNSTKRGRNNRAQLSLFTLEYGAIGDVLDDAAAALAEAIRRSRWSREQLIDQLRYLLGREISIARLNAWTSPTNANRIPADVLIALCQILGDWSPLAALIAPAGMTLATPADRAAAELGDVLLEREKLAEREAAARRLLTKGRRQP